MDSGKGLTRYFASRRLEELGNHVDKPKFPVFGTNHILEDQGVSRVATPTIESHAKQNLKPAAFQTQKGTSARFAQFGSMARKKRNIDGALLYNGLEDLHSRGQVSEGKHCTHLFYYLWAPNNAGKSCPLVKIPDTLLVQKGSIKAWLFTNKHQQIKKKNRERLEDTKNLVDAFSRKTSQSMHGPSGPSQIRSMHIANTRTASGSNDAKFLPMDHTALKKMLNVHTGALPDGVIQKFVGVSGEVHTLLRVQWEESLFKVSKVLMDTVGMSPGHSKPASQEGVSITLQTRIQELCDSIVHHVYDVSPQKYRIDGMTLFMKNDHLGSIYLLFCTNLKVTKLCENSPSTISKTATYKPVVTPMYFNRSPTVESCAVTMRIQASQSMRRPKKENQHTINTSRSMDSSTSSDEFEANKDSSRTGPQSQEASDIWETKPLTKDFRIRLMKCAVKFLQKKSVRRQRFSQTKNSRTVTHSCNRRTGIRTIQSAGSKRRKLEQLARPSSAPTTLRPAKKKDISEATGQIRRLRSTQVPAVGRTISSEEYLQWLGKSRPQTLQDVYDNQASQKPYLIFLQSINPQKAATQDFRLYKQSLKQKNTPWQHKEAAELSFFPSNAVEGSWDIPSSNESNDHETSLAGSATSGLFSKHSKRGKIGTLYKKSAGKFVSNDKKAVRCTEMQRTPVEGAPAGYKLYYSSQHVERMRLQMRLAEKEILIEDLKSRLVLAENQANKS